MARYQFSVDLTLWRYTTTNDGSKRGTGTPNLLKPCYGECYRTPSLLIDSILDRFDTIETQ